MNFSKSKLQFDTRWCKDTGRVHNCEDGPDFCNLFSLLPRGPPASPNQEAAIMKTKQTDKKTKFKPRGESF